MGKELRPNTGDGRSLPCVRCGTTTPDASYQDGMPVCDNCADPPIVSGVDELVAFLRAALDEDERKIAAMEREETRVRTAPIFQGRPLGWLAGVDIFVSSKRWRAEVKAKRRILDLHVASAARPIAPGSASARAERTRTREALEAVARLLAQPYAGQPGWRDEWAL